jgi:hypothetical protein
LTSKRHFSSYGPEETLRCERVLLTLLGDLGPWSRRVFLAGGMAPRYIAGELPAEVPAHVGTTDLDLIIDLVLGDETPEAYRTLQTNLEKAGFRQRSSFQWERALDGSLVLVELLCETDQVEGGRIFKPRSDAGSRLGAVNIRGANLVCDDFIEIELAGERLDGAGQSNVTVRVANVLTYSVLKIFAFQDRHENKDSYDLVFTLANYKGGPSSAGEIAAQSSIAGREVVIEAIELLKERFASVEVDGPIAYARFLSTGSDDEDARRRREAVAAVRQFLAAFSRSPTKT